MKLNDYKYSKLSIEELDAIYHNLYTAIRNYGGPNKYLVELEQELLLVGAIRLEKIYIDWLNSGAKEPMRIDW